MQPITGNTRSAASRDRLFDWLSECCYSHSTCAKHDDSFLPDRLVDLGPIQQGKAPRLVEPSVVQRGCPDGEPEPYVCLSHCWGVETPLKLTSDRVKVFKEGIPAEKLPETFKDAIVIAREFSVRYIWIDSLCIIQDDVSDWEHQAKKMAAVYRNCTFTIAATASKDGSGGCFRDIPEVLFEVYHTNPARPDGAIVCRRAFPHWNQMEARLGRSNDSRTPLLTRAWAFQEHILAPRVLQFTESECMWECNELTRCECGRANFYENPGLKALHAETLSFRHSVPPSDMLSSLHRHWLEILVPGYTARKVTFSSDALPALSGVAAQMQEAMRNIYNASPRYVAGFWVDDLLNGLAWTSAKAHRWARRDISSSSSDGYTAPTWSWASIPLGAGTRWAGPIDSSKPLAQVVSVHCEPSGKDPFGAVAEAHLQLTAPVIEARIIYDVDPSGSIAYFAEFRGHQTEVSVDYALCLPGRWNVKDGETVLCVYLGMAVAKKALHEGQHWRWPFKAMVLKSEDTSRQKWMRIGLLDQEYGQPWVEGDEMGGGWFHEAETRTITIF